jgi:aminopeptidase N
MFNLSARLPHSEGQIPGGKMPRSTWQRAALCAALGAAAAIAAILLLPAKGRADEPYARSRDYDLQHVKTHLWIDFDHKSFRGEVTHSIEMLHDGVGQVQFDSIDLKINAVTLDGKDAKFNVTATDVVVPLNAPSKKGDKHEIFIRYEGTPKKGLYFVGPDKNYPKPKTPATTFRSTTTRTIAQRLK